MASDDPATWTPHPKEPRGCPTPGACSAAERIAALEAENAGLRIDVKNLTIAAVAGGAVVLVSSGQELSALRARCDDADNAMRQALSDFEWAESVQPGTHFQSSILLLRHALRIEEG